MYQQSDFCLNLKHTPLFSLHRKKLSLMLENISICFVPPKEQQSLKMEKSLVVDLNLCWLQKNHVYL